MDKPMNKPHTEGERGWGEDPLGDGFAAPEEMEGAGVAATPAPLHPVHPSRGSRSQVSSPEL